MHTALGLHVFAGGFTRGVQQHGAFNVLGQLEIHSLGKETVERQLGLSVHQAERWQDWPRYAKLAMLYGNPRCTGFSCLTAGHDKDVHGPWAKQTRDIHDVVEYAMSFSDDDQPRVLVWESVQQAYSTGKELLHYLRDVYFIPNNYRIAHLFINAASFGNAQRRKRYFFLAYKRDKNFNVTPPVLDVYRTELRDVIGQYESLPTQIFRYKDLDYTPDSSLYVNDDGMHVIRQLPRGFNFNMFAKYHTDKLPEKMQMTWNYRSSDMPFSMHCPYRLSYDAPAPTLWGSCQFVHPVLHRLLTIRELSCIMGWDYTPVGPNPIGQIAKGIVPAIGTWLAEQARAYLDDEWGTDDFASRYDARAGVQQFVEANQSEHEKVFHLTDYMSRASKLDDWSKRSMNQEERTWLSQTKIA